MCNANKNSNFHFMDGIDKLKDSSQFELPKIRNIYKQNFGIDTLNEYIATFKNLKAWDRI